MPASGAELGRPADAVVIRPAVDRCRSEELIPDRRIISKRKRLCRDEDRRSRIDARHQPLPCHGRDPAVWPGLQGRDLRTDRTQRDDRLRHHRGADRRPPDHSPAHGRGARSRPRTAPRHAQAQSGGGLRRRRQARERPDHRRGHQLLRRHRALARPAGPDRPADGVGDRRPGRGRGAPLRQRRGPRDVGDLRRLRRSAGRGRAGGGGLPAKPDP